MEPCALDYLTLSRASKLCRAVCAAGVLLQKPRSPLETYNDLDGSVVTFFRVLRDKPDELIRRIELTPWARAEYDQAFWFTDDHPDAVERARRLFVAQWMGISDATKRTKATYGWRVDTKGKPKNAKAKIRLEDLYAIAHRLQDVQIECLPAGYVLDKYDTPGTLFYIDPPYAPDTQRTKAGAYAFDWNGQDHWELARQLWSVSGLVVLSGYMSSLYQDLYGDRGWTRIDKNAYSDQGQKRTESLWLSPRTVEALQMPVQMELRI